MQAKRRSALRRGTRWKALLLSLSVVIVTGPLVAGGDPDGSGKVPGSLLADARQACGEGLEYISEVLEHRVFDGRLLWYANKSCAGLYEGGDGVFRGFGMFVPQYGKLQEDYDRWNVALLADITSPKGDDESDTTKLARIPQQLDKSTETVPFVDFVSFAVGYNESRKWAQTLFPKQPVP